MQPEPDRRGPAVHGAVSRTTTINHGNSSDDHALTAEVAAAALGCLMNLDIEQVRPRLVDVAETSFPHLVLRFVFRGIRAAVEAGDAPRPMAVAAAARREGIEPPPGWRGLILSNLVGMANDAPAPAALVDWYLEQLKDRSVRHAVTVSAAALHDRAWLGDSGDLADLLRAHITETSRLLQRVEKL